ncbi:hypothetical protein M0802_006715 [Mischocyttarus mexicanus]|nr:hypothetical protein M0802_006715 [Mischocyttarus mexicanus]
MIGIKQLMEQMMRLGEWNTDKRSCVVSAMSLNGYCAVADARGSIGVGFRGYVVVVLSWIAGETSAGVVPLFPK